MTSPSSAAEFSPGESSPAKLSLPHGLGRESRPEDVRRVRQVHGGVVLHVDSPLSPAQTASEEADALVSTVPGLRVGIYTSDCVPVLFECTDGLACGIAHAGWRGLVAGVLEATVESLRARGGGLRATLGPCIGPCCFEVGDEVAAQFEAPHVHARHPRPHVNLRSAARDRLAALGVLVIGNEPPCTHCDPSNLPSYRRDGPTGRSLHHWIGLPA